MRRGTQLNESLSCGKGLQENARKACCKFYERVNVVRQRFAARSWSETSRQTTSRLSNKAKRGHTEFSNRRILRQLNAMMLSYSTTNGDS
jgi:hypothetical protein